MASKNPLLPTKDQCFALTDEQCRKIQDVLDPDGTRPQKSWELQYQPELIRLYMTGMSFPQIESTMTPRLTWSYKTYSNRFRDWCFPLNPNQRDNKIIQLYALVSESSPANPIAAPPPIQSRGVPPIRPRQPQPRQPLPPLPQNSTSFDQEFHQTYEQTQRNERNRSATIEFDRNSISTIETIATNSTWVSSSAASIFSHPDYASHRDSIATANSSVVSLASQYSYRQPKIEQSLPPLPQPKPIKPPRHDSHNGLWNGILRVIPCGRDHSSLDAFDLFDRCSVCGFTPWHALMVHARSMERENFDNAMGMLSNFKKEDFAGNSPVHFLMVAGVEMDYFARLVQHNDTPTNQKILGTNQNVFGQNPLHVLNPRGFGEDLIPLLEWFKPRRTPPGLLLTQRDIYGRTPLHALLQHPLPRNLYPKVLEVFPFFEHQLRSLDIAGQSTIQMMTHASLRLRSESESDYLKIQDGITDIKQLLAESVEGGVPKYGFNDIARGARGESWFGHFECRICNRTNAHSNSYVDQMKCACAHGRDRNAPDDTGLTPAHAIVTKERSNANRGHETATQTEELFRILIPQADVTLREALHVLDPEGNTLVHNIATRGFDRLLKYVLELETPGRRVSMVNACTKGADGSEKSVYEAVVDKVRELNERIRINRYTEDRRIKEFLVDTGNRLQRCKHLLVQAGAVANPSITKRWRISG